MVHVPASQGYRHADDGEDDEEDDRDRLSTHVQRVRDSSKVIDGLWVVGDSFHAFIRQGSLQVPFGKGECGWMEETKKKRVGPTAELQPGERHFDRA